MRFICKFTILTLFFSQVSFGESIEVKGLGNSVFELTLNSDHIYDQTSAQSRLLSKAKEICAGFVPEFGMFKFYSSEQISSETEKASETGFSFSQEIHCVSKTQTSVEQFIPFRKLIYKESEIERIIRAATSDYFHQIWSGAYENAYESLTNEFQVIKPYEGWKASIEGFNNSSGASVSTEIWRVTIYDNPPNSPKPGLYIAADFRNEFSKIQIQCGYFMWYSDDAVGFKIMREESGEITKDSISQMSEYELNEIKQRMGCGDR